MAARGSCLLRSKYPCCLSPVIVLIFGPNEGCQVTLHQYDEGASQGTASNWCRPTEGVSGEGLVIGGAFRESSQLCTQQSMALRDQWQMGRASSQW